MKCARKKTSLKILCLHFQSHNSAIVPFCGSYTVIEQWYVDCRHLWSLHEDLNQSLCGELVCMLNPFFFVEYNAK